MSYALSADAEVAVAQESAKARTPNYSVFALGLMGVAALPWIPVGLGALAGRRWGGEHGPAWGAAVGTLFSFLVLRDTIKKTGGVIT